MNHKEDSTIMRTTIILLFASCLAVGAETEEQISKRFPVQPGGKLVLDVDFGSIEVISANDAEEVVVDVLRKVSRGDQAEEEEFLRERPVTISQEGNMVTVHSRHEGKRFPAGRGSRRTEAKYTITVPSKYHAQLKTSGGGITISDLTGEVTARTSGGSLQFTRIHGDLDGQTSGGSIRISEGEGTQKVKTGGGSIAVTGGSGALEGETSGGSITVKNFRGPTRVETSGGNVTIEEVNGKVEGSTSGGSISALFRERLADEVKLETAGGGVTLRVPETSAFDLDAATSGGSVKSDLLVTTAGKPSRNRMKGPVNGGGKPVMLRTSGGSIQVKTL